MHRATLELLAFSKVIIQTLEKDALSGCRFDSWKDYENGNGTTVGPKIDKIIKRAKRNIKRFSNKPFTGDAKKKKP